MVKNINILSQHGIFMTSNDCLMLKKSKYSDNKLRDKWNIGWEQGKGKIWSSRN